MNDSPDARPPAPLPVAAEPSAASLARSVRGLRIWLAVLTAVVSLALLGVLGIGVLFAVSMGGMVDTGMGEAVEAGAESTRADIESALGDKLDDLDVRVVSVDYGAVPFPYSMMDGGFTEKTLYVEYRVKGHDVVVADVVSGPFGPDAAGSGILPTRGTLASRMSDEQFDRLLTAYAAQTDAPLGSVRRYNDMSAMMMEPSSVPEVVPIGNSEYPSKELWSAMEGRIVEGDEVDMNDESFSYMRTAHVFHEDPETGEFTYLGTEPTESMW